MLICYPNTKARQGNDNTGARLRIRNANVFLSNDEDADVCLTNRSRGVRYYNRKKDPKSTTGGDTTTTTADEFAGDASTVGVEVYSYIIS